MLPIWHPCAVAPVGFDETRGEPPSTGTIHIGWITSEPVKLLTSNSERSGEMLSSATLGKGNGIGTVSPPAAEACATMYCPLRFS